jgi:hypothetical protein
MNISVLTVTLQDLDQHISCHRPRSHFYLNSLLTFKPVFVTGNGFSLFLLFLSFPFPFVPLQSRGAWWHLCFYRMSKKSGNPWRNAIYIFLLLCLFLIISAENVHHYALQRCTQRIMLANTFCNVPVDILSTER